MSRFENKVAVVTGAAQGIGEAYARALAAEGCLRSWVADCLRRAPSWGRQVASDIGGIFVRTDVSSAESAAAMVEATVAAYGGIDLLVNNAAIYGDMDSRPADQRRLGLLPEGFMSVNMD